MRNTFATILFMLSFGCGHKEPPKEVYRILYSVRNKPYATFQNAASGFIIQVSDSLSPLFLTAHHVVSTIWGYKWNQIKDSIQNPMVQSLTNPKHRFNLAGNLPINNAGTSVLDVAAFFVPDTIKPQALRFSKTPAAEGDTVILFAELNGKYNREGELMHKAVVVYQTDSTLAYQFVSTEMRFEALINTSGSPVFNRHNEVVALAGGGFYLTPQLPQLIKDEIESHWPGLIDICKESKLYGMGVPSRKIKSALLKAMQ